MFSPIRTLFTYFPLTFFLRVFILLAIDIITAVLVYKFYKKNKLDKCRAIAVVVLVTYITIVLFFTVLGRRTLDYYRFGPGIASYYTDLLSGNTAIDIIELMINIFIFVPIGMISGILFRKFKIFWAVAVGLCTSLAIEFLQLILRSGFVSLTDVIHNTIGSLIGGLLTVIVILIANNINKSSKSKVKTDDSN